MSTRKLLKVVDLAEQLQVPISTVYVWRHRGEGPKAVMVGRLVRFRQEDVDAWLERVAGTAQSPQSVA